jgi:hypothetical protein
MRWLIVAAVLGGCTESPTLDAQTIAATFCDCVTPTGTTACIDELTPQLDNITPQCTACVEQDEATCSSLLANCETLCINQVVPDGNP